MLAVDSISADNLRLTCVNKLLLSILC